METRISSPSGADDRRLGVKVLPQTLPQCRRLHTARKTKRRQGAVQGRMRRGRGRQPPFLTQPAADVAHQRGDAPADSVPAETRLEVDGRGHRQPRTRIARTLKLQKVQPRRRAEVVALVQAAAVALPTPAYLQRLQPILVALADVEKTRAGWRQQPLAVIGPVEVAADRLHVQRHEGRSVGAVDHRQYAAPACLGTQFGAGSTIPVGDRT